MKNWPKWTPTIVLEIQALEDRQPAPVTTEETVALDNHTGILAVLGHFPI